MIIKFEIDNKEYQIKELSLQDYYDIKSKLILEGYEAEFEIVSILSGCPIEEIKALKYEDWEKLYTSTTVLINNDFTSEGKFSPIVEVEGGKYGFMDMDNISIGEFSDLDVILTAPNSETRLHEALAILYRPIIYQEGDKYKIEKYGTETYKDRVELFKKFPLSKAKVAIAFFLHSGNRSLKAMLGSLTTVMRDLMTDMPEEMKEETNQILKKLHEDGSELFSYSPAKTHSNWMTRVASTYGRVLIGLRGVSMKLKKKNSKRKNNNQNIKA